jgi:hypothetical protein
MRVYSGREREREREEYCTRKVCCLSGSFGRWLRFGCSSNDLGDAKVLVFAEWSASFDSNDISQGAFCIFVVCKVVLLGSNGLTKSKKGGGY